jgi:hypothetical protein
MNTLNAAGQLEGLDIAEVNINLQDALKSLETLDQMSKEVSAIRNAAKKIEDFSSKVRTNVTESLTRVQAAISKEFEAQALESPEGSLEIEE